MPNNNFIAEPASQRVRRDDRSQSRPVFFKSLSRIVASVALLLASSAAFAADVPGKKSPPAPPEASQACLEKNGLVNDVFGFNGGSDVNDWKGLSLSGTYGGSFGTRAGYLNSHSGNLQATYSPYPCVEVDPYVFGGVTGSKTFGVKSNGSTEGAGIELKYKLLGRDPHGFGLTFDLVLQGAATNGAYYTVVGRSDNVYDTAFSIFADKELVAGKLYGALNVSYDWNFQDLGGPRNGYANTSIARFGAALAYQISDGLFVGAEGSHFRRYDSMAFNKQLGYATFLGPNFYWAFTKSWALSGAWNLQVDGRAKGTRNDLDLTNFSQHIVKLKLNHDF
ncbi:hypothetical protein SAMN05216304_101520 [Bosea sp. OK403]|uniref:hypothetical protein n=1 Tax=Bosea sp. OK403 TaxID=1855286 RepID=UPI0008ED8967|nr:hypothetical protein [Bosea sp. OK403]SFI03553.1 hypothetical protein SAMN05216304_101520 [Bosea sp. OK403]